jgi:hypothetical protein
MRAEKSYLGVTTILFCAAVYIRSEALPRAAGWPSGKVLIKKNMEVKYMYRLLFREAGTQIWNEGPTFRDEELTPDAREMLVERHARSGLEAKLERISEDGGDEDDNQ